MRITRTTTVRVGLAVVSGATFLTVTVAHAATAVNFAATGSAYGMRLIMTVPQAPLTPTPVDAGGPAAQAMLDSIGNERGMAALPYPGDAALSGPGLLAGLIASTPLSQLPPPPALPGYPFYAQSDAQHRKATTNLPFADMESTASPDAVMARIRTPSAPEEAPSSMGASSTITRLANGGVSTASASSVTGVHVGPLTVGSVTSTATMALDAEGNMTRKSSFTARALEIAGTSVDASPEGFSIGGNPLPLPTAKALSEALKGAGIDIAVLPASQTSTSVVTAALQITRHQDFGPGGKNGSLTLILGQSSVSVTGTPHPALPALGFSPVVAAPSVPAAPVATLPTTAAGGSAPYAGGPSAASFEPTAAAPPPAPPATVSTRGTERAVAERFDSAPAYWALVGAVLLTALAGPALRLALKAISSR